MNDYVAKQLCTLADGTRLAEGRRVTLTPEAARYPLAVGWIARHESPPPKKPPAKPARKRRTAPKG